MSRLSPFAGWDRLSVVYDRSWIASLSSDVTAARSGSYKYLVKQMTVLPLAEISSSQAEKTEKFAVRPA
jgi:hypothetical protein